MYSLVVVENDLLTRRGLVSMVNWEDLGFRIAGEFSDGQETLEFMKDFVPDVILTEIQIPNDSGMDLARFAAERNLPTQIVFLTSELNMTQAQLAVEYHVAHYLFKPVPIPRLRAVFQNIRENLDQIQAEQKIRQRQMEHYQRLIRHEKQKFVTDAYFGALSQPDKLKKRLHLLDIEDCQAYRQSLYLMRLTFSKNETYKRFVSAYGQQELQEQILRIVNSYDLSYDFFTISWNDMNEDGKQRLLGILWQKDERTNTENSDIDLPSFEDGLQEMIFSLTSIECQITGLYRLPSLDDLTHCAEIIEKKEGGGKTIPDLDYLQTLRDQKKALYTYLCQKDQSQVIEQAHLFLNTCMEHGLTFAHRQCYHALTMLIDRITDNDLKAWNKLYMECMSPQLFVELQQEELERRFDSRLMILYEYVNHQSEAKGDSSFEKVMSYIQEHFCEDITLTEIAEKVFLNPVYISRLIKEQTGMNYTELVMELRINRAVELLENTDRFVYEVADEVGYHNLKYFYKVFKKIKGRSPGDYRPSETKD